MLGWRLMCASVFFVASTAAADESAATSARSALAALRAARATAVPRQWRFHAIQLSTTAHLDAGHWARIMSCTSPPLLHDRAWLMRHSYLCDATYQSVFSNFGFDVMPVNAMVEVVTYRDLVRQATVFAHAFDSWEREWNSAYPPDQRLRRHGADYCYNGRSLSKDGEGNVHIDSSLGISREPFSLAWFDIDWVLGTFPWPSDWAPADAAIQTCNGDGVVRFRYEPRAGRTYDCQLTLVATTGALPTRIVLIDEQRRRRWDTTVAWAMTDAGVVPAAVVSRYGHATGRDEQLRFVYSSDYAIAAPDVRLVVNPATTVMVRGATETDLDVRDLESWPADLQGAVATSASAAPTPRRYLDVTMANLGWRTTTRPSSAWLSATIAGIVAVGLMGVWVLRTRRGHA